MLTLEDWERQANASPEKGRGRLFPLPRHLLFRAEHRGENEAGQGLRKPHYAAGQRLYSECPCRDDQPEV